MIYPFKCTNGDNFEVTASIHDGPPKEATCPQCGELAVRVFTPLPSHWHTQGAHVTDYDARGDKLERLNKEWSEATGEKPPPPSPEAPKNSSEPY